MIRLLRACVVTVGALVGILSCDLPASVSPAVEVAACAYADERLSVAFRDPARARRYLLELRTRLKGKDGEAVREAADLIARLVDCLPEP